MFPIGFIYTADAETGGEYPTAEQIATAVRANLDADPITVTVGTNNDKAGYALSATGLNLVMVESDTNLRQGVSVILAMVGGVISGAATTNPTIGNRTGTARVAMTTDADGNRSAITHTPYAG